MNALTRRSLPLIALALSACGRFAIPVEEAPPTLSGEERVTDARARRGDHYADLLAEFIEETPSEAPGGWVFLGDSITEQFPLDDAFPDRHVINRGIGGDVVDGVIERLDVSVADLAPSRVYLMIGINNLVWATPDIALDEFLGRYEVLFEGLERSAPDAEIFVQSILPARGERWGEANVRVLEVNARLQPLAERFGFQWVNLHPVFLNAEDELREECAVDGVHLNVTGYMTWLETLFPEGDSAEIMLNLAPQWLLVNSPAHRIDKLDPSPEGEFGGNRGRHELIVYTPAYGRETTGTNEWGREAIVEDGVVVALNQNDSTIPANGFVISGHLTAHWWINTHLRPGVAVEYDGSEVRCVPTPWQEMTPQERLSVLHVRGLEMAVALRESEAAPSILAEVLAILRDVRALDRTGEDPAAADVNALALRLMTVAEGE